MENNCKLIVAVVLALGLAQMLMVPAAAGSTVEDEADVASVISEAAQRLPCYATAYIAKLSESFPVIAENVEASLTIDAAWVAVAATEDESAAAAPAYEVVDAVNARDLAVWWVWGRRHRLRHDSPAHHRLRRPKS